MLVPSKLFNIIKAISIILVLTVSQGCLSEEKKLTVDSLQNPEKLKMFVKNGISEKNKKMAENYPYSGAIAHRKKKDWAAASKGFAEASLLHPTAKSLIALSESEAKFYTQNRFDDKVAIMTLKGIGQYLKGAIAVDSIQKEMTQSEIAEVNSDIACISDFLKSRVKKPDCKYVNYIYQVKE